ncbi:MAG: hypothetical protein KAH38_06075, partial [Candidatus Hydrogenedentes bacterium]|nr:hypothetical protein [Candidatus Hydrogenedentota bacterium]
MNQFHFRHLAAKTTVLCIVLSIPLSAQTFNIQQTYETAFQLATGGDPYQAAITLIETGRQVPGDDASIADDLVGPAQFAGFIGAFLLDDNQRFRILTEVIDEKQYELDHLLVAALQAFSGVQTKSFSGIAKLELHLSKSKNKPIKVAALYMLGSPYYFRGFRKQIPSVAELVLVYPDLELTRHIVETPVWRTSRLAIEKNQKNVYLLKDVVYAGGRREAVLQKSPGLRRIAERMPSLNLQDVTDDRIAAWAEDLREEHDPAIRYALVCWFDSLEKTPSHRKLSRPALESLIEDIPNTPEAVYARILLTAFDRDEWHLKELRQQVSMLLPSQPLPSTPERCFYIETMKAVQETADFFVTYGLYSDSIRIHEALAAAYPNSALAISELDKAQMLRDDPLEASL